MAVLAVAAIEAVVLTRLGSLNQAWREISPGCRPSSTH